MILLNCASELASWIDGSTLAGVDMALDENVFCTQFTPLPYGNTVVFLNSGGLPPEPYMHVSNLSPAAYFKASVQVLVYGNPNNEGFAAGEALAREVLDAVAFDNAPSSFVTVRPQESQPTYIGVDPETQRHIFSMNLQCEYKAQTISN